MQHTFADGKYTDLMLVDYDKMKEERDALANRIEVIKMQRYELMGVIADVNNGNGFDSVCADTVARVIYKLKNG